jgi:hypothetical protein
MRITFKKIAKSLTGISTPVFGVSWTPPESDREVVRRLVLFFEDRRALYNPFDLETPHWVIESVLEIRKRLTETIVSVDRASDIAPHLRAMRAACRKFMDEAEKKKRGRHPRYGFEDIFAALGEMRAILGIHIGQLCVKYRIDIEGELSSILPIEDDTKKEVKDKDEFLPGRKV